MASEEGERLSVTLRFESEEALQRFMGGLSDGWGENFCTLEWPWQEGMTFDDCRDFKVPYVWSPDEDEDDAD